MPPYLKSFNRLPIIREFEKIDLGNRAFGRLADYFTNLSEGRLKKYEVVYYLDMVERRYAKLHLMKYDQTLSREASTYALTQLIPQNLENRDTQHFVRLDVEEFGFNLSQLALTQKRIIPEDHTSYPIGITELDKRNIQSLSNQITSVREGDRSSLHSQMANEIGLAIKSLIPNEF